MRATMIRRSAVTAVVLLGAFHLWLFGHQVWSGQLAEPAAIARWLLALALGAGLIMLRRRGLPMVIGRQAVTLWVLVALLHGPALANDSDGFAAPAVPEAVVTLVQAAAAIASLGLAFYLSFVAGSRALPSAGGLLAPMGAEWLTVSGAPCATRFLPRPPPIV
jgi:hypothetical protein